MQPRELALEPRASFADVLRGRARVVGARTTVGRHYLDLPRGVVSPYEARMRLGLHYGDPAVEEARYENSRSRLRDMQTVVRWALGRLGKGDDAGHDDGHDDARPWVVSARVDPLGTDDAIARVLGWLRSAESRRVFFVHPHALNLATRDQTLRADLGAADLVLPDGVGIRVAARLLGLRLPANVNGTDLVPELLRELAADRIPVALLGGAPGVAGRAASAWQARTGVTVAGVWDGFRAPEAYEDAVRTIERLPRCLVLVGMGSPRQERFARQHFERCRGVVAMTVGGLFDFVSGGKARAPLALRELGLEWAWRLAIEPRRLGKRYIVGNPEFLLHALRQRLRDD